jgi:hypothetical protein
MSFKKREERGKLKSKKKKLYLITLQPPKENTFYEYKCYYKCFDLWLEKPL